MAENPVKTLVIDNFKGSMTPYQDGDINSGLAYVLDVFGYDPFTKPGNLTWNEAAVQIDSAGSVITDLILAGKVRVESGILYTYCIGHTGRVYKIQVNDPVTYNPDYDNPVLLTTLTVNTPTFTRGGFIDFYGATEKIIIGHDKGVTSLNFDGTGEAFVGVQGSYTQTVPRPLRKFLGNLYVGNGANFAEINSTMTVASYAKLSPAFPTGTQVRDLDVTPDGVYLQSVVTELALGDITATTPPTTILYPSDSFVFKWNGTDVGYTSFVTYPSTTLSANILFGENQFIAGYDFLGGGFYNPVNKFLTSTPISAFGKSPLPNAVTSYSNTFVTATTLPYEGATEMIITQYGTISQSEIESGYWCVYGQAATGYETDVVSVPCMLMVSNFAQGGSGNGYTDGIFGKPKVYFSTLETSSSPTTKYKLYKWSPVPTVSDNALDGAVFQTQNQIFSKKVKVGEVRIYGEPWTTGVSFIVELIGSAGTPITGSAKTFTVGTNLTSGADFAWYTPEMAPTYAIGLRITNNGTVNHTITKAEIDYSLGGK